MVYESSPEAAAAIEDAMNPDEPVKLAGEPGEDDVPTDESGLALLPDGADPDALLHSEEEASRAWREARNLGHGARFGHDQRAFEVQRREMLESTSPRDLVGTLRAETQRKRAIVEGVRRSQGQQAADQAAQAERRQREAQAAQDARELLRKAGLAPDPTAWPS